MKGIKFTQVIAYLWEVGYYPAVEEFSRIYDGLTVDFFLKIVCFKEHYTGNQNPTKGIFKDLTNSLNTLSSQLDSMIDFSANIEYKSPELLKMAFYVKALIVILNPKDVFTNIESQDHGVTEIGASHAMLETYQKSSVRSKDPWEMILDLNLGSMAEKRRKKMLEFASRSEFKIDTSITKVYDDIKSLKNGEIDRLYQKYLEVKLNFEKGVDMFLVLATIVSPKKAYNKLGFIFAQKLEQSKKTSENAILRQSMQLIIQQVMKHVKVTFFQN